MTAKIFYLYAHEVIGEEEHPDPKTNIIKNAFQLMHLPSRSADGQGLMFLPAMNEITDVDIKDMDLFPTRPPTDEEKQIYEMMMRERSPLTVGVTADMVAKLKELHDKGLAKG
jgi:hypothetical protein